MSSRYLTLTLLVLTGACQPAGQPDDRTGASAAPIIGGSPAPDDGAVVWLVSYPSDESSLSSCTASVIAPDVLLTAAHCVDPDEHPDHSYGVYFGADGSSYATISELIPQLADIASATMHPDYDPTPPFTADIALVTLAEPTTVAPLPLRYAPLPDDVVGRAARIVGYGATQYGQPNSVRHTADTVVADYGESDTLLVGDVAHKSCVGDSGGPALSTIDNVETIIGVDSFADLSGCLEPAHYRRTDTYADFIATEVPPPAGQGGSGAGGEGQGGMGAGAAGLGGATPCADCDTPVDSDEGCAVSARHGPSSSWGWLLGTVVAWGAFGARRRRQ